MQKPKNRIELEKMRTAGRLAAEVLDMIAEYVKEGVSTLELNDICHDFIVKHGAIPAPLNYRGFPKSVCTSLNDVVCHGIPNAKEILQEGDMLNIDVTVVVDGYHGDTSRMYGVGKLPDAKKKLIDVTYDAMMAGISTVKAGSRLGDIGRAIEPLALKHGYSTVREYCGHGIGKIFHDDPMVVHYAMDDPRYDKKLRSGLTFTVEPMINEGVWQTELQDDDWTVLTADRKLSAQFEHTVAVTPEGFEILTESPIGLHKPTDNL